jgi:tyrosyl-tRNA synthetase
LNPIIEITKYIIFPEKGSLKISRSHKYGGDIVFDDFDVFKSDYAKGSVHPLDLKNSVADELTQILEVVRNHFKKNPKYLNEMRKIEVTR